MAGLETSILRSSWVLSCVVAVAACASGGAGKSQPETAAVSEPVAAPAAVDADQPEPETIEPADESPAPPIEVLPEIEPETASIPNQASGDTEEDQDEDDSLVVIDTGAKDLTQQPVSLVEAARAERERRGLGPPTEIVITDKNLSKYASGGELTIAEPADPEALAVASELSAAEKERAEQEAYWRDGARQIRQAWRDAWDRVGELEEKVFELRQQFYREDDGFYRDSEIKPAWDRAIEQLEEARAEVEARQRELTEFTEQGRQAGALPGWLREGVELEPPVVVEEEETAEPNEPVIYQQEATNPP